MPLTLHLGVYDLPYSQAPKAKRRKVAIGTQTTGDVAGWLEDKYGVMEMFYEMHAEDVVAPALEDAIDGAFEDLLMGAPLDVSIFGSAEGRIDDAFRKALDMKEFDNMIGGVPTAAAERGVDHRKKHPYVKRPARQSFIDTGLYQSSFKSWVD